MPLYTQVPGETVWKVRFCTNWGFTRPRNEDERSQFGTLQLAKDVLSDTSSDFPDSLSTLDFSHLAAWQTASLKGSMGTPETFSGRCARATRKKSSCVLGVPTLPTTNGKRCPKGVWPRVWSTETSESLFRSAVSFEERRER